MERTIDTVGMRLMEVLENNAYVPHSEIYSIKPVIHYSINPTTGMAEELVYTGIFEVLHEDWSVSYIKSSSGLRRGFEFDGFDSAEKHLKVYNFFAREGFYHPDSFFGLDEKNGKYGIVVSMPKLLTVFNSPELFDDFPEDKFENYYEDFFRRWPMGQFDIDAHGKPNYGLGVDDRKFHYYDMHLFKNIPSELVENGIIKSALV